MQTTSGNSAVQSGIRLPVSRPSLPSSAEILPYLREIDERRWYSNRGPLVTRLEDRLRKYLGLKTGGVVTTANATVGITAALLALRVPAGSLCLMPSWTFCATPHAARAAGMLPWFQDVARGTWALDPEQVTEAVRKAPGAVGAVVVVAPFGAPVDLGRWEQFERATGIAVVVDAAAGFDSARASRIPVVVSLHATKILGAGEGGFVATEDPDLRERVAACCNFGFQGSRAANFAALNAKMSEYHAAVAMASLDKWPETRVRHVRIGDWYRRALDGVDGVVLQPDYGNGWVGSTTSVTVPAGEAARVSLQLMEAGVETRSWWSQGCHLQPAFTECACGPLPVTEDLGRRVLGLPHFPDMQEKDVAQVAQVLSGVVRPRQRKAERRAHRPGVDLYVGGSLGRWALDFAMPAEVSRVVTTEPELAAAALERGHRVILAGDACTPAEPAGTAISVHYPRIFTVALIARYRRMYNLHPGYLPWGRGFYPVFWALWEKTPAGATLHHITAGLDQGPLVDQIQVEYGEHDTGGCLHARVQNAEKELLRRYWPRILAGEELAVTEQAGGGSYHSRKQFFDLRETGAAALQEMDLARLARALEFPGYEGLPAPVSATAIGTSGATSRDMPLPDRV